MYEAQNLLLINVDITGFAIIGIGLGIVNCFFGYRIFKILLSIQGFVLGVLLTLKVIENVGWEQSVTFLVVLIGGCIGLWLIRFRLYRLSLFLFGATNFGVIAATLYLLNSLEPDLLVIVAGMLIAGYLTKIFERVMIIILSALSGATFLVITVLSLLYMDSINNFGGLVSNSAKEVLILVGVVGAVFQFFTTTNTILRNPSEETKTQVERTSVVSEFIEEAKEAGSEEGKAMGM